MRRLAPLLLLLAAPLGACGDTRHRPIPEGAREPRLAPPPALPAAGLPTPSLETPDRRTVAARPPLEIEAAAVEGFPPLPTYRAKVRNVSGRPVRSVLATAVYLDAAGRAMPGEDQEVRIGSPLKAIEPGMTLETTFLSRVDRAPGVRLVIRSITFLENGPGAEPVPREWPNPDYAAQLAEARSN